MKRILLFVLIASFTALLCSCEKDKTSGGGGGGIPVVVDPAITGTWDVVKFEGLDKNGAVIKECTDANTIKATYHRFTFGSDSIMRLWYGEKQQLLEVDFFYDSFVQVLWFGESGFAEIDTLDETDFIFTSDSFLPNDWYQETSNVKEARVYCKKVIEE